MDPRTGHAVEVGDLPSDDHRTAERHAKTPLEKAAEGRLGDPCLALSGAELSPTGIRFSAML
jgi:hypothetical protein